VTQGASSAAAVPMVHFWGKKNLENVFFSAGLYYPLTRPSLPFDPWFKKHCCNGFASVKVWTLCQLHGC